MQNALDKGEDQISSMDSLILSQEFVSKNSLFEHIIRFFKQLPGTSTCTNVATSYSILFMGFLEDKF